MTQTNQNFEIYQGDTKNIVVTVSNNDGTLMDITAVSIKWRLKIKNTISIDKTTTNGGISITDSVNGKFTIHLVPSDTTSITGNFYHEAEITDVLGNVSTIFTGVAKVIKSIIQ